MCFPDEGEDSDMVVDVTEVLHMRGGFEDVQHILLLCWSGSKWFRERQAVSRICNCTLVAPLLVNNLHNTFCNIAKKKCFSLEDIIYC